MRFIYFKIIIIVFLLFSCSSEENSNKLTVGTFNIAWLGDGIDDRVQRDKDDHLNLIEVINLLEADILAVQEIENQKAASYLKAGNKNYNVVLSSKPEKQKVGFLIKNNIDILDTIEIDELTLNKNDLRPGLILYCRKDNFDFYVSSLHFKSTSRYDDTPEKRAESYQIRAKQAEILSEWVDSVFNNSSERDIIFLGDLNDNPSKSNSSIKTLENDELNFITADINSCKFPVLKSIDHIVLSNTVKNRFVDNSLLMLDIVNMFNEDELEGVSDHCPIIAKIDIGGEDND